MSPGRGSGRLAVEARAPARGQRATRRGDEKVKSQETVKECTTNGGLWCYGLSSRTKDARDSMPVDPSMTTERHTPSVNTRSCAPPQKDVRRPGRRLSMCPQGRPVCRSGCGLPGGPRSVAGGAVAPEAGRRHELGRPACRHVLGRLASYVGRHESVSRYGRAQSPAPMRVHTCQRRVALERSWTPTSSDECPGCAVEAREGWPQLVRDVAAGVHWTQRRGPTPARAPGL